LTKKKNPLKRAAVLICFFVFLAGFVRSPLLASDRRQGTIEFVFGSFTPNDDQFKKVYQKGGSIEGLVLSTYLVSNFNFYLEMKGFHRTGTLTFTKEKTDFYLFPLTFGIRYIWPTTWFLPYIGVGTDFFFYYENNPIGTSTNYAHGYHLQVGTYFQASKSIPVWLNLRIKYTTARTQSPNRTLQLGGLEYAIGLALVF
jgi:hypothetical protein